MNHVVTAPFGKAVAIVNDAAIATTTRAIYVGGAGDIVMTMLDSGLDATFKAVPVGTILPVRTRLVKATGTTATLLLALT